MYIGLIQTLSCAHSDLFFKFGFNLEAQVLALRIMKDNNASSRSCLTVDTKSFDKLLLCKLERTNDNKRDLCSTLKDLKK